MGFLAPAMPFLAAASAGMQALGSIAQGKAASNAAKYNAQVAENNAKIAKQNATFAGAEGAQHQEQQGLKNRATSASIRANQGASGIDVNSGSAADVQASQRMLGQLDVANIRANAVRKAYGFQTDAVSYQSEAALQRTNAKNATKAGYIGAASTLLSSAAGMQSSGGFDPWTVQTNKTALNSVDLSGTHTGFDDWQE